MAKGFGRQNPKNGNKKRQKAYINLIFELLHTSGDVVKILTANQNLIDYGLMLCMKTAAIMLAKDRRQLKQAEFLDKIKKLLLHQLEFNNSVNHNEILHFISNVLQISYDSSEPHAIYPVLEANIHRLNHEFIQGLQYLKENICSQLKPEQLAQIFKHYPSINWSQINLDSSSVQAIQTTLGLVAFTEAIFKFPRGNKAINIEIAIAGNDIVSSIFTHEIFPEQWAACQMDLGVAYRHRVCGERSLNLEQAIQFYHNALLIFTPESHLGMWAYTLNNLAIALSERIQGNRAENLEQAIAYCQQVLRICDRNIFPEQWGKMKMNLGTFYKERVCGDKIENLELSIRSYNDASSIFTQEAWTRDWGMVQDGLGISYCHRIKGDAAENIEQAISYFKAALQVRNYDTSPVEWVKTQAHLATAYWARVKGNKTENLELAINCLQAALQVATFESMPVEWAMVQINMASIYSKRIKGNWQFNPEAAIRCFYSASQVYTKEAFPQNWATLQNNLGLLYGKLGSLEENILCLQASLEICTYKDFPSDWASTQYNLGLAYCKVEEIEEAINCFLLSLKVFKPAVFPLDCFMSGEKLGNTAFTLGRWHEAIEAYNAAIEAVETSRSWAPSENRRQEILEEAIDVYQNIVQACINAGQIEKAFEYAERTRSKSLVDLMVSNDLYQVNEIPPQVEKLLQQYDDLQRQIDQERFQNVSSKNREPENTSSTMTRTAFEAYNETIATLEAQKQLLWQQIRRLDPVLAGEIQVNPLKFGEIQKLIDHPTTAILSFYTTNTDTYIFVLRQNHLAFHTCAGQGIEILQNWISQNWLFPYLNDKALWENQMQDFLEELAQTLEIKDLIAQHLQGIEELILVPHLLLHQIPFAALPIGNNQYLADKFTIRYTPSCQILEFCQQRPNVETLAVTSQQYGTIENAEDNLACAAFEGEEIAKLYNIPLEKRLIRSQATCDNYRQLAKQVQVLHSCHHAQSRLDNPLESQLKFADGSITLGQLMSPSWRLPNLFDVFLSCCETNLGVPSLTDDIFTLSTGFLCAGARSVVSSLWAVDDLATALFSIYYYQQRQKGNNRPEALRQAQIKLREMKQEDLTEISKLAEFRRKEAKSKRKQFQEDSAEYLEWDVEYRKYAGVSNAIWNLKKSGEQFPFAHPRYWSAFICQGLR